MDILGFSREVELEVWRFNSVRAVFFSLAVAMVLVGVVVAVTFVRRIVDEDLVARVTGASFLMVAILLTPVPLFSLSSEVPLTVDLNSVRLEAALAVREAFAI